MIYLLNVPIDKMLLDISTKMYKVYVCCATQIVCYVCCATQIVYYMCCATQIVCYCVALYAYVQNTTFINSIDIVRVNLWINKTLFENVSIHCCTYL